MTYGPFINSVAMNLVHYFFPVFYGDTSLYVPKIGTPRQCFEMKCTISIESPVLMRIPFQATTSSVITPNNPLFDASKVKENSETVSGPISECHSKGFESKCLFI